MIVSDRYEIVSAVNSVPDAIMVQFIKPPLREYIMKKSALFLSACVLTGTLIGCSGGGSSSPAATTPPPSGVVTGVATPAGISVVTAK